MVQRTTTRTSVQSLQPIDVTSEDDEEGRASAVVARDGRSESSKEMNSNPDVKMKSRQEADDDMDHMNVEGKPRLDNSEKALPTNFASTKRKSANFLDEILAEKVNKKKRKKKKLKEDFNRGVVA